MEYQEANEHLQEMIAGLLPAPTNRKYSDAELIKAAHTHACEWVRNYAVNSTKEELLLLFSISFLNKLAYWALTPDFNETMDKLTWEATERVNELT